MSSINYWIQKEFKNISERTICKVVTKENEVVFEGTIKELRNTNVNQMQAIECTVELPKLVFTLE